MPAWKALASEHETPRSAGDVRACAAQRPAKACHNVRGAARPAQAILAGYAHIHCIVNRKWQWVPFRRSINRRVPVGGQAKHSLRYLSWK